MNKNRIGILTLLLTLTTIGCATNCPTKQKKQRLLTEMNQLIVDVKSDRKDPKLVAKLNSTKLTKEKEKELVQALDALIKGHKAIQSKKEKTNIKGE